MEILLAISYLTLGLTSFVLGVRRDEKFKEFFLLLALLTVGIHFAANVELGETLIWFLLSLSGVVYIGSRFTYFRTDFWAFIVILIAVVLFLLYAQGTIADHVGLVYVVINKFTALSIGLALLVPYIVKLKKSAIQKVFQLSLERLNDAVGIFVLGLSLFLASFGAGYIGVYIVASIIIWNSFFHGSFQRLGLAALLIAMVGNLAVELNVIDVDAISGDVLLGLMTGVFSVLFLSSLFESRNKSLIVSIATLFIAVATAVMFLFLGDLHPGMGGVDALLAILIGTAIVHLIIGNIYASVSIAGLLLSVGIFSNQFFSEEEVLSNRNQNIVLNESEENNVALSSFSGLNGSFDIISDTSFVSFFLGQKDETKGEFKRVYGSVRFDEDLAQSKFNIGLKLADFTTFNKFRNESLMEEEYLNVEKYAEMSFVSDSIRSLDSLNYVIDGQFEMLGQSLPLTVTLNRLADETGVWIVGEGKIDRTRYGMTPSSTEGNIVTFSYKALLNQK